MIPEYKNLNNKLLFIISRVETNRYYTLIDAGASRSCIKYSPDMLNSSSYRNHKINLLTANDSLMQSKGILETEIFINDDLILKTPLVLVPDLSVGLGLYNIIRI